MGEFFSSPAFIGGLFGIIGAIIVFLGDWGFKRANVNSINTDTIGKLFKQVSEYIDANNNLEKRVQALEDERETLQGDIKKKDGLLETQAQEFEEFKNEMRSFFAELFKWLDERGIEGYPKPSDKLLETNPKHKLTDAQKRSLGRK